LQSDKNNGTLHDDLGTFVIISRSVLRRMRNISAKFIGKSKYSDFQWLFR